MFEAPLRHTGLVNFTLQAYGYVITYVITYAIKYVLTYAMTYVITYVNPNCKSISSATPPPNLLIKLKLGHIGGWGRKTEGSPDRESKPSTRHPHRTHDTTGQWREKSVCG